MRRIFWLGLGLALVFAAPATARPAPSSKLDSALRHTLAVQHGRAKPQTGGISVAPLPVTASGKVLVDVYLNGPLRAGAGRLRDRGMSVKALTSRAPGRIVEGWVPVNRLDDIARLPSTRAVMAVQGGFTNTGSVLSEGDARHHGPQARAFGVTGAGVPVGIMSDSINRAGGGVAGSQSTGDLPADVQIIADGAPGDTDEGRAMAEIVYDTAPGIPKILFATGTDGGPVDRAANIDALVANGAKVIADDTVFLTEPFFQDGAVTQAVDRAKANGTAYFASAGNRARESWEGNYIPAAAPGSNDFDPGAGEDTRQTLLTMPANRIDTIVLQWAEPVGGVTTDLELDVYAEPNETTPALTINSNNIATGIPAESVDVASGGSPVTIALGVKRLAGTGAPLMKWIQNPNFAYAAPEHDTASEAIDPDAAAARGGLAVAAVNQSDPGLDTAEPFSSRGPSITRFFSPTGARIAPDVRLKPDIAGADGVSTTLGGHFAPFFGTSAAAPSAAGVGALLWSAKPSLPIDELYAILREPSNAADCAAPGFPDADCGAGFIFADGKLGRVLDATPPDIAAVLPPPDGANGWYHADVTLTWSVSDPGSPIGSTSNCGPQTVTTDSVQTFTCSALSAGGTTNQPVTIKRDATPPSTPKITGIKRGTFNAKRLPTTRRVRCSATDPTSGVDSCKITRFSRRPGRHKLTATATNDAGLQSKRTLRYKVRPYVVRGLRVPRRISLAALSGQGLPVKFKARAKGAITLTLKRGTKRLAHVHRRFRRGANRVTLRGNRAGALTLIVKATSARFSNRTATIRVRVR